MRRIRHIAATLLLLMAATAVFAQNRVVSGTVLDTGQQPLIGAAVLLAGMFGFQEAKLLEVETPEMREAPKVSF